MFTVSSYGYSPNSIYVGVFDIFPSSFRYDIHKKDKTILYSLTNIDDIIEELRPDRIMRFGDNEPFKKEDLDRYPELNKTNGEYRSYSIALVFKEQEYMILLDLGGYGSGLLFLYNDEKFSDIDYFIQIGDKIKEHLYYADKTPQEADLKLVYYTDKEGFKTITSKVNVPDINLSENYNDDITVTYDKLTTFLKSRDTGICFLRGEPGTGKSYFLRYLLSKCPNNYIFVPNNITSHLASPDFLSFMIDNKDSIFILEDCEQVLFNRELNPHNTGISGILNIADGLMSDVLNIKFICTFNTDLENIDKALLREGRCIINYEFKPLTIDKTQHLLNKLGKQVENCCEMTLAQIYNYNDQINSEMVKKKIGF